MTNMFRTTTTVILLFALVTLPALTEARRSSPRASQSPGQGGVTDGVSRDANGFYLFTPSTDSRIVYLAQTASAVSTAPSDSNNCIYAANEIIGQPNNPQGTTRSGGLITPCLSLKKGYDAVRDGYPDHLYLKRADTWIGGFSNGSQGMTSNWLKGGRSNTEYMVVGAWKPAGSPNTTPRPTLRINTAGVSPFHSELTSGSKAHFALTDLHATHDGILGYGNWHSFYFFGNGGRWADLIIQNNHLDKIGKVNMNNPNQPAHLLDVQGQNGGAIDGIIVFGNILSEARLPPGAARTGGVYFQNVTGIRFEKNTFYKNGLTETDQGHPQAHALYFGSPSNGLPNPGLKIVNNVFLQNSDIGKVWSENGEFDNNSSFENSIGIIECCNTGQKFRYNTFNNARDYNSVDQRGIGFYFNPNGAQVTDNIMAHQTIATGWNVRAVRSEGPSDINLSRNIFFDWCDPNPNGTYPVASWSGSATTVIVEDNDFQQQHCQDSAMYFGSITGSAFTFRNNNYHSLEGQGFPGFSTQTFSQWRASKEPTAVWQQKSYRNPYVDAGTYLTYLGLGNYTFGSTQGNTAYWNLLKQQDRLNWNPNLEAAAYNDYVRYNFDKPILGGGGGCSLTPTCRTVDLDQNCLLNIGDYVAMQNLFAAHDLRVDFDGSGSLTPNDFMQFQDRYVSCVQ